MVLHFDACTLWHSSIVPILIQETCKMMLKNISKYCFVLLFQEFMPPPDSELPANELPNVEYIIVECLMYTFHQLARRCPQWLTDKDNAERLKDFRQR